MSFAAPRIRFLGLPLEVQTPALCNLCSEFLDVPSSYSFVPWMMQVNCLLQLQISGLSQCSLCDLSASQHFCLNSLYQITCLNLVLFLFSQQHPDWTRTLEPNFGGEGEILPSLYVVIVTMLDGSQWIITSCYRLIVCDPPKSHVEIESPMWCY